MLMGRALLLRSYECCVRGGEPAQIIIPANARSAAACVNLRQKIDSQQFAKFAAIEVLPISAILAVMAILAILR
jgi:hypothetical protein